MATLSGHFSPTIHSLLTQYLFAIHSLSHHQLTILSQLAQYSLVVNSVFVFVVSSSRDYHMLLLELPKLERLDGVLASALLREQLERVKGHALYHTSLLYPGQSPHVENPLLVRGCILGYAS